MDLRSLGNPSQGLETTNAPAAQNGPAGQHVLFLPRITDTAADIYHGAEGPAAPNLLTQTGVGAYLQLLSSLAGNAQQEKTVSLLNAGLQDASVALRSAYEAALSRLSPELAAKSWGFSLSNGSLIFTSSEADLPAPELLALRNAFAATQVESAAQQVAALITSIAQMRKEGLDSGSLALVRLDVEAATFGADVDLRSYVSATAPGGLYHSNTALPAGQAQIPPMLGGMDLRALVTARPRFLRADGSVNPEVLQELAVPSPPVQPINTLHGQCACGQVRFSVQDEFEYAFYCHCSRCRARTGSAFAAVGGITLDKVEVLAGHEHLLFEGECSDGYGARCGRCFAFLFAAVRARRYLHISLGALVDAPGRVPDHHIYVGSKAPWYQITDGLPQYTESP